jgi:hypothetical protein
MSVSNLPLGSNRVCSEAAFHEMLRVPLAAQSASALEAARQTVGETSADGFCR